MKRFSIFALMVLCILVFAAIAFAMTDNGNGTRTFAVGSGQDFATVADIVWGHPAGVMTGDRVLGITVHYQASNGGYTGCTSDLPANIIFDRCIRGE